MPIGKARFAQGVMVRLFRTWSASRNAGRDQVTSMLKITQPLGLSDRAALSCASFFELVEGHLGRALIPECCCSQEFSTDEKALIGVLASASRISSTMGDESIPHGLPDAICWSAVMVRDSLGLTPTDLAGKAPSENRSCPFSGDSQTKGATHGI